VGLNGVYYRDLGFDGRDYPVSCVFDGPDHDRDAQNFIRTLLESALDNPGILEHPVEGVKQVVVDSGRVIEHPTEDAAETIVEVLFQEQTLPPEVEQNAPTVSTQKQFSALSDSASSDFAGLSFIDTANGRLSAVKAATANINKISETMSSVARGNSQVITQINLIQDDILRNIDTLVKAPATLADQAQALVGTIRNIPGNLQAKIAGWKELYEGTRSPDGELLAPNGVNRNALSNRELTCTACVGNMLLAIAEESDSFTSSLDALNTLEEVQALRADLEAFLAEQQSAYDESLIQDQYISQSETLDQMATLAQIAGNAVRAAVPQIGARVSVVLPRDHNVLTLCWTYYESIDDPLPDQVIDTNRLDISGIVLLKKGTEILL
jgi:prophage DNA circulation protein